MQASIQCKVVENLHWLFQLPAYRCNYRRENLLLPRWIKSRLARELLGTSFRLRAFIRVNFYRFALLGNGTDSTNNATNRRSRHGPAVRSPLVGSGQRRAGLGREWSRSFLHVRRWYRLEVFEPPRLGFDLPRSSGCRRWLRVLCQTLAGDALLGPKLLRRVRQRWRDDVSRWLAYVFVPGKAKVLGEVVETSSCLQSTFRFWSLVKRKQSISTPVYSQTLIDRRHRKTRRSKLKFHSVDQKSLQWATKKFNQWKSFRKTSTNSPIIRHRRNL